MKALLMTHDVTCAFGELASAARRSALLRLLAPEAPRALRDLAIAAIAFTIQLAIDEAGRDPAEMRALERSLLAALGAR